jgi:cation diffusion facilitator family transporter
LKSGSKKVVLTAFFGNGAIAICKFIVAMMTGSTAMLAETIHSIADTGNQVLLMIGLSLSTKPADRQHPFGYGKERYFWAMMAAVSMFVVGAVVSFYHGVHKVLHPEALQNVEWAYLVLGLSFLFESYPLYVAYKEMRKEAAGKGVFRALRESKRPTVIIVFFEDSAALIGIVFAFAGILITQQTGLLYFDGVASICIGLLLGLVAVSVAYEVRSLLIGEGVSPQNYDKIIKTVSATKGVVSVVDLLTMHLGPDDVLVNLNVHFSNDLTTDDLERVVDEIEAGIKTRVPEVTIIFVEAEDEPGLAGEKLYTRRPKGRARAAGAKEN